MSERDYSEGDAPIYEEAVDEYLALVNGPTRVIGNGSISPPVDEDSADLIAAVRRGVESGEIEGGRMRAWCIDQGVQAMLDRMDLHRHSARQFDHAKTLFEAALLGLAGRVVVEYPCAHDKTAPHWVINHWETYRCAEGSREILISENPDQLGECKERKNG